MNRFAIGQYFLALVAAVALALPLGGCAARGPGDGIDDDPNGAGATMVDFNGDSVEGDGFSEHELRAHRVGGGTHPASNNPAGGPVPDPWKKPTGPVPDPWNGGGGSDPNPPPDPDPNPDPDNGDDD
jgi:hypothetical protein